jgi:hypothetical protein
MCKCGVCKKEIEQTVKDQEGAGSEALSKTNGCW